MRIQDAAVALCVIVSLAFTSATATTVLPPTFEEMVDRADLVLLGKVVNSRAEWRTVGTNRVIFTLTKFATEEVLKGRAGGEVTLQFLGGTVGDVTLEVAGVPKFNAGERELLFIQGNGTQFCPIVAVFHGKFSLRKDEKSGQEIVVMHNGRPLRDVREIGNGEGAEFGPKRAAFSIPTDRGPMPLETFKSEIRHRLSRSATQR